jgi:hypothetical protein
MKTAKIALMTAGLLTSGIAFAGQPVGGAMVSAKVVHTGAEVEVRNMNTNDVAAREIKSFQWGSEVVRTEAKTERVVKANNLTAKPSVITWPVATGTAHGRGGPKPTTSSGEDK